MFYSAAKFNHLRQTAARSGKPIKVTIKELEKVMKASGMNESDIKMHISISKIMGGSVLVGDKLFELKKEKKNDKQTKKSRKKAS